MSNRARGFTLIELSIVLVIIGLIAGGVLVGQDLIRAAVVRAQISQIEKYNQAVNTFHGKYGYLPGDIISSEATKFGFQPRGCVPYDDGDGNGLVGDVYYVTYYVQSGETVLFWRDLSDAKLIDNSFNLAQNGCTTPANNSSSYVPAAKINASSSVYVYPNMGNNFFGIAQITSFIPFVTTNSMTVQQAYAIDKKIDDGLPLTGNVMPLYVLDVQNPTHYDASTDSYVSDPSFGGILWSNQAASSLGGSSGAGTAVGPLSTTCYDNDGNAANIMHYSLKVNNGAGVNCSLSFRFQ